MTSSDRRSLRSVVGWSLGPLAVCVALASPSVATAHTRMIDPPPLSDADNVKTGACGCTAGVDCAAGYPITELTVGQQLNVVWQETIQHDGDFRIAFVPKKPSETTDADFDNAAITETVVDVLNTGMDTVMITMPATPCDECTLQVRQNMVGAPQPFYYSCAAVRILDPNATGSGGAGGAIGVGGAGGDGGASATSSSASGSNGDGGTSASIGAGQGEGGEPQWQPEPLESGCSTSSGLAEGRSGLLGFASLLALAALARRRNTPSGVRAG
jgi:MYXO-CTERM domain-containing protein